MTIQEQIQIIEDNLKEYGQCNITIEEYNYIKDELYSSGCLAGIELGKKEAVEKIRKEISKKMFGIEYQEWSKDHIGKIFLKDLESAYYNAERE